MIAPRPPLPATASATLLAVAFVLVGLAPAAEPSAPERLPMVSDEHTVPFAVAPGVVPRFPGDSAYSSASHSAPNSTRAPTHNSAPNSARASAFDSHTALRRATTVNTDSAGDLRFAVEPASVPMHGTPVHGTPVLSGTIPSGTIPDGTFPTAAEANMAPPPAFEKHVHDTGHATGVTVKPYGALWVDMLYSTSRTNPGTYTLFVLSGEEQGEDAFAVDGRRSRFGMNLAGPGLPDWADSTTAGRVEIDFQGSFVNENRAGVLLRLAYLEVKDSEWRLLAGQAEDVISPLTPSTINYAAGYNAGNIGFRRAQFRAERQWLGPEGGGFTLQASLNQDVVTDFPTDPGIRRETAGWPVCEGRMQWAAGPARAGPGGQRISPLKVGISGHIGESGFDFLTVGPPPTLLPPEDDARFITWSVNLDVEWRPADWWRVRGELFRGANLSSYLGGIGQGVCPCRRVSIRGTGGWVELGWDWSPCWHSNLGIGIDDPQNRDSLVGRIQNHSIYTNVLVDLSPQLTTGLEIAVWRTLYHDLRAGQIPDSLLVPDAPGEAVTLDWMVKYAF